MSRAGTTDHPTLRPGASRDTTLLPRYSFSDKRRLTDNGAANFAPYFFPDGERVLFSSNLGDPHGREFEIYAINVDGTDLEQITFSEGFDGFPMFNSDGTKLVFASNRDNEEEGETNIFVTDWVE